MGRIPLRYPTKMSVPTKMSSKCSRPRGVPSRWVSSSRVFRAHRTLPSGFHEERAGSLGWETTAMNYGARFSSGDLPALDPLFSFLFFSAATIDFLSSLTISDMRYDRLAVSLVAHLAVNYRIVRARRFSVTQRARSSSNTSATSRTSDSATEHSLDRPISKIRDLRPRYWFVRQNYARRGKSATLARDESLTGSLWLRPNC